MNTSTKGNRIHYGIGNDWIGAKATPPASYRKAFIFMAGAILLSLANSAKAAPIGLFEFMNSLPTPYTSQTGDEAWTFHLGDASGPLMSPLDGFINVYGAPPPEYYRFGAPAGPGHIPGTAGTTEANGIFAHPAQNGLTAAVFHVKQTTVFNRITLTYELAADGNQGNGINVSVNAYPGGEKLALGAVSIDNVTSQSTVFSPRLLLLPGDIIEFAFDNNGNYFYDHGWIDVNFDAVVIPLPGALLLFVSGLLLMARPATKHMQVS